MEVDGTGLNESRGSACEIVAWQLLTYLSERELIDYLLFELPRLGSESEQSNNVEGQHASKISSRGVGREEDVNESTALLQQPWSASAPFRPPRQIANTSSSDPEVDTGVSRTAADQDIGASFEGLNALEIAAIANAKKFLSQRQVQKTVQDIWNGDVIFWQSMSTHAVKKAQIYNQRIADPYSRLRVPKYQKAFQTAFFASFLALYYAVLVERNPRHITIKEVLLHIWIAAFAYDEFGEFTDAGMLFYQTDFWSLWDLGIIGTGVAFLIASRCIPHRLDCFQGRIRGTRIVDDSS